MSQSSTKVLVTVSCAWANRLIPPFANQIGKRVMTLGSAGRSCHSTSVILSAVEESRGAAVRFATACLDFARHDKSQEITEFVRGYGRGAGVGRGRGAGLPLGAGV